MSHAMAEDMRARREYPCRHCGIIVNIAARMRGWSELAKWGAEEMARTWGILCDACYARQENVR